MTRQEKNVVVTPAISAAAAQTLVADTIEKLAKSESRCRSRLSTRAAC